MHKKGEFAGDDLTSLNRLRESGGRELPVAFINLSNGGKHLSTDGGLKAVFKYIDAI